MSSWDSYCFFGVWASEITRTLSDWMIFALTMMADYLAIRAFFALFSPYATSLMHGGRMAYAAALSLLPLFAFCFLHSFRRKSRRHVERNDSEVIAFPAGFNSFVLVNFLFSPRLLVSKIFVLRRKAAY